jgi:5-methylcytosine-specific restriction protein B
LLQEYFFGDYGKIGLVIGSGFVKRNEPKNGVFAEFDYEDKDGLGYVSYDLIPFKDIDFNAAIQNLIK